uniref:Uncharacterized protein n=1 Tax=Pyxicephalus adspersus TaxID=30357 RepID=A0AAV3AM50_PYXAD|nr:TPA: hypothetical protein GDO54_014718 [Pyxicephalus adspersus]
MKMFRLHLVILHPNIQNAGSWRSPPSPDSTNPSEEPCMKSSRHLRCIKLLSWSGAKCQQRSDWMSPSL